MAYGCGTLRRTGLPDWLFVALGLGLVVYGGVNAAAVRGGAWFTQEG